MLNNVNILRQLSRAKKKILDIEITLDERTGTQVLEKK